MDTEWETRLTFPLIKLAKKLKANTTLPKDGKWDVCFH